MPGYIHHYTHWGKNILLIYLNKKILKLCDTENLLQVPDFFQLHGWLVHIEKTELCDIYSVLLLHNIQQERYHPYSVGGILKEIQYEVLQASKNTAAIHSITSSAQFYVCPYSTVRAHFLKHGQSCTYTLKSTRHSVQGLACPEHSEVLKSDTLTDVISDWALWEQSDSGFK